MYLLLLSSVSYQIFYHLPVHQRLPAEEIYFQITAVARILDQEVQRFLTDFIAHKCSSSMIFPFFCKTVFASKVTVVCNMQAQCLYNCLSLLYFFDHAFICIFYK